jgi:RND superfamily putative drug exporter
VFAVWVVIIAAGLSFAPRFFSSLSMTGIWVGGSQSSRAAALLSRDLPATGRNQVILVFSSHALRAEDPRFQEVVSRASHLVSRLPGVTGVELPTGAAAGVLTAPGGHTALAVVALGLDEGKAEKLAPRIDAIAAHASTTEVEVDATGETQVAHDVMAIEDAGLVKADAVGLPVALLVLLAVFGSLVAAGLPILLALASLGTTFGVFGAISLLTGSGFNSVLESATVLIGLGIGIDYALFIVSRFREELRGGSAPAEAAATATATAGRTVLVSGSTVIATIAPVLMIDDGMVREGVLGPMVAVAILVAAALTLLPSVLTGLGNRIDLLSVPSVLRKAQRKTNGGERLTRLILRSPIAVLLSVAIVLGGISYFTLQLHTGLSYGLSAVKGWPSGRADSTLISAFGPGEISPIEVVFTTGGRPLSEHDLAAMARFDSMLQRDPRVRTYLSLPSLLGGPQAAGRALRAARTDAPLASDLGPIVNVSAGSSLAVTTIVPRKSFDSVEATQLVTNARSELRSVTAGTGMHALVGGSTAAIADVTHEINSKTPFVVLLTVTLAFLLMALAFRNPRIALVGLVGTMFSVGAATGLLVLVFQEGLGQSVLGFHSPGFIQNWLPLFLFAVLVGLSTDYQVFLISRVQEEWRSGHDPTRALVEGLQRSSRIILSAAAIMVVVFASFLLSTELEIKEFGFALASVVLVDAAVTRRLFIPAALRILGRHAWPPD